MKRLPEKPIVIAQIKPEVAPLGEVLQPMKADSRDTFPGWVTPLAPWGGFNRPSALAVVRDEVRQVLEWSLKDNERALLTGDMEWRNYRVVASVRPMDADASPNADRPDWKDALVGIIFRVNTSRFYYQFGIEGRRRAVLYRRTDDEWFELAAADVEVPDDYLTLDVNLDGDGMRCSCGELGVCFFVTDTKFRTGRAGVRGMGRARLANARVMMTPSQREDVARRLRVRGEEESVRGEGIPGPKVIRTFDLKELGGIPMFVDFARPGRYDMLIHGKVTRALTVDGDVLWEIPEAISKLVASTEQTKNGRILYGFIGTRSTEEMVNVMGSTGRYILWEEMCVIRGDTGEILARRRLPEMDGQARTAIFSTHTGRLSGRLAYDIILREWRSDVGNGRFSLWAYDQELEPLWENVVDTPYGHAHAVQFEDVNGDGRDEVLAGGTLFSSEGEVLWVHDRADEMAMIRGAQHCDAVAIGNLAGEPSTDPVAFLMGGSAGVYVVDGLTGVTRMVHRIGHAQGRVLGKVRGDLPGTEVLVPCRWGNMGILTLFSGNGDRLWSIQPDYIGQGSCPVNWGRREEALIWSNTTAEAQAFYDGYGRRVKDLPEIREIYGDRIRKDVATGVIRMGSDPGDLLSIRVDDRLYVFEPGDE